MFFWVAPGAGCGDDTDSVAPIYVDGAVPDGGGQDVTQVDDATPPDDRGGRDSVNPVPPAPDDDPEIVALINALPSGESMRLPEVVVRGPDSSWYANGPDQRNFCNRMAYAPDRETALYAGGNHGSPHVISDVWEYHLGSNTWQNLYEAVGGNHARWLDMVSLVGSNYDGTGTPDPADVDEVEQFKTWWRDHVELSDGYLHDNVGGGPLYPRHTWDTLVYDPVRSQMVWPLLASGWLFRASVHQHVHGLADPPVLDTEGVSRMWLFDPATGMWNTYRNPPGQTPPTFRAVAASMVPIGGSEFVYFTSSQAGRGEIPGMWLWDTVADTWTEMGPNGGRDFRNIAVDGDAPRTDGLAAYSPTHDVILSVGQGRYVGTEPVAQLYRFSDNTWGATTPPAFAADDSTSMLVYASAIERFVLINPSAFHTDLFLYDPVAETWEQRALVGSNLAEDKPPMGYYDPRFDVVVLQQKAGSRVFLYRP